MDKTYSLAEFQDLAWAAGFVSEFEYARHTDYVYNTYTKTFRQRLNAREQAAHVSVLNDLGDIFELGIATRDTSGFAADQAVEELCFLWRDHINDGWPLDYLIQADGLEVSRILSRWFAKLEEALVEREECKYESANSKGNYPGRIGIRS